MSKKLLMAKQYLNEKLGVSKRELNYESDLVEVEKKFEAMKKFLSNLSEKLEELIQPNPHRRNKKRQKDRSEKPKKSGTDKEEYYAQVEDDIAEVASECGRQISGLYGHSLKELAEHFNAISELKDKLDLDLRVHVIDEINSLKDTQIKDAQGCKKKLASKRLQLEALNNQKNANPNEVKDAIEKYNLSVVDAFNAYLDFSENTQENKIAQLLKLAKKLDEFYKGCSLLTGEMVTILTETCTQASHLKKIPLKTLKDIPSPKSTKESTKESIKESNSTNAKPSTKPRPSKGSVDNTSETDSFKKEEYSKNEKNEKNNKSFDYFGGPNKDIDSLFYSQENVSSGNSNFGGWNGASNSAVNVNTSAVNVSSSKTSKCQYIALFDMKAEGDDELEFKEGDIITLTNNIDADWIEGELRGKIGIVPKNFIRQL